MDREIITFVEDWLHALSSLDLHIWLFVLLTLGAILIVALFVMPTFIRSKIPPSTTPTSRREHPNLTAISLLIAVALAGIGYFQARTVSLNERTLDLLAMISVNDRIAEADFRMAQWIRTNQHFRGDIDKETDRDLINLLDYYEFLGVAWEWNSVQEDILLTARCGPMIRGFEVTKLYIADRRRILNAPRLYSRYEKLVEECRHRALGT